MNRCAGRMAPSFTPITTVASISPFAGTVRSTLRAPRRYASAAALFPEDARRLEHDLHAELLPGSRAGSFSDSTATSRPFTEKAPSFTAIEPLNRPWTESYFNRWARVGASVRSLTAATSIPSIPSFCSILNTWRPMRPKPLIPTLTFIFSSERNRRRAGNRWCGRGFEPHDPLGSQGPQPCVSASSTTSAPLCAGTRLNGKKYTRGGAGRPAEFTRRGRPSPRRRPVSAPSSSAPHGRRAPAGAV